MSASVLQVFVMRDGQLVASEVFAEGLYTVGSEPDCDLVLNDPSVAGVHASLQFQGGAVELTDNESHSGLVINGQPVPAAQIRSSDDVRVGPFLIKTRVVGKKPALRPGAKPGPISLPPGLVSAPPPATPQVPAPPPPAPALRSPAPPPAAPARPPAAAAPPGAPARPPVLPAPKPPPPSAAPPPPSALPRFVAPPAPPQPAGSARPVPAPPPRPLAPPAPRPPAGAQPITTPPRPAAPVLRSVPPPIEGPAPRPAPAARAPAGRPAIAAVPALAAEPAGAEPSPFGAATPLASEDLLEDIDFLFDQALERHATEAAPTRPGVIPAGANAFGEGVVELSAESAAEAHAVSATPPQVAVAPARPAPAAAAPPPARPASPAPRPAPPALRPPAPMAAPPAAPAPIPLTPAPITLTPAAPLAKLQPAPRPIEPAPLPLAAAAPAPPAQAKVAKPSKAAASGGGLLLHARVFWGDSLLYARSFGPEAAAFSAPADSAVLASYGFTQAPGAPLAKPAGSAWTIAPPADAQAFLRASTGWVPAAASGAKEVRLDSGGAIRLARGHFQLELSAPAAPPKAKADFVKNVDFTVLALLLVVGAGLITFIKLLPPMPAQHPQEKEVVVRVQARIKEEPPPKPKKKPVPLDAPAPEKQAPAPIAQATTLKAAGAPLKSLEKITKATRGLSNLLASLDAAGAKGGKKSNIAMIPTLNRPPGETAGMGGFGPCCAIGPITKGGELLKSGGGSAVGALTGATAGQGGVSGVPISMPVRQAKVQGTYDRDALGKVINEHLGEIRACYERALLRNPDLGAGKVQLEWTINLDGSVGKVGAKVVTIKSNEVVSCLLETIKEIKFPKPTGGEVIVGYPVLFNSVGG